MFAIDSQLLASRLRKGPPAKLATMMWFVRNIGVGAALVLAITLGACGDDDAGLTVDGEEDAGRGPDPCEIVTAAEMASVAGVDAVETSHREGDETVCIYTWSGSEAWVDIDPEAVGDIDERREYATQFATWRVLEFDDIGDGAIVWFQPTPEGGERLLQFYAYASGVRLAVQPLGGTDWTETSAQYQALVPLIREAVTRL